MLALGILPVVLDPLAPASPAAAFKAVATAAQTYLKEMEAGIAAGILPDRVALMTRVRGTGPGVSFGSVVSALQSAVVGWICPFEGCMTARGSVLRGADLVGPERDDAFLLLRFAPHTLDLPLHTHEDSDRFICAIEGRGFFHVSPDPLEAGPSRRLHHAAVRDRDALMFRRGTVHTFSTAEHPLTLLSYHSPYISLADERQYTLPSAAERPAEFLRGRHSQVSFDPAWSVL